MKGRLSEVVVVVKEKNARTKGKQTKEESGKERRDENETSEG